MGLRPPFRIKAVDQARAPTEYSLQDFNTADSEIYPKLVNDLKILAIDLSPLGPEELLTSLHHAGTQVEVDVCFDVIGLDKLDLGLF